MSETKNKVTSLTYEPGRSINIIGTNSITMVEIKTADGTIINVRLGMNETIEIIPSNRPPQVTFRDPQDLDRQIRAVEAEND